MYYRCYFICCYMYHSGIPGILHPSSFQHSCGIIITVFLIALFCWFARLHLFYYQLYRFINTRRILLLILDSRTWHGTTENTTNKSRWLINAVFSIWSMKQQIDFPKTIPPNIFNKLNNKQKQILGYCSIPPKSENDRINIKCGYEVLK